MKRLLVLCIFFVAYCAGEEFRIVRNLPGLKLSILEGSYLLLVDGDDYSSVPWFQSFDGGIVDIDLKENSNFVYKNREIGVTGTFSGGVCGRLDEPMALANLCLYEKYFTGKKFFDAFEYSSRIGPSGESSSAIITKNTTSLGGTFGNLLDYYQTHLTGKAIEHLIFPIYSAHDMRTIIGILEFYAFAEEHKPVTCWSLVIVE